MLNVSRMNTCTGAKRSFKYSGCTETNVSAIGIVDFNRSGPIVSYG